MTGLNCLCFSTIIQKEDRADSNHSIQVNHGYFSSFSVYILIVTVFCYSYYFLIAMFPFSDQPPLVVIFEDFEGFLPAVVQNFVMICRYKLLSVIKSCLFYLLFSGEKIVFI